MLTHSLVVEIVAKPEQAEPVAQFLADALAMAEDEAFTPVWFALRADETTFYIVDAFAGEQDRERHLQGPIAAALMSNASQLLASPPRIVPADVLAAKVTH